MKDTLFKKLLIPVIALSMFFLVADASFAGDTPGKDGKAQEKIDKAKSADQVHLDFNEVDIKVFIQFISGITGKNFIIDNKVRGKISIISPDAISIKEAYDVFESVLEIHGFAAVKAGKLVKIIQAKSARQKNIVTKLKLEAVDVNDHVITQLIPLKYADPGEIKRLFTPLVSKNSSILSYGPTNTLIVTDLSSNIHRLLKILQAIDVTGIGQEITVIPLEFADAKTFNSLLTTVFKAQRKTGKKSSSLKAVKFVADDRTNSIVVLASKGDTERIIKLVRMLDREVPRGKEKIHVVYLENATAEELAKVLQSLSQKKSTSAKGKTSVIKGDNLQITADKATNSLIIIAEKTDYVILESIIKKLDIPRTMVYVECLIMEVNVAKNFNLGTEWTVGKDTTIDGRSAGVGIGFDGGSSYGNLAGLAGAATGVSTLPAGFAMGVFSEAIDIGGVAFPSLGAVINAYKKDEEVKILSTPQILTTDNEEASISVGQKIPYLTKDVTGETNYNNYEYKDVGISLKVTPQINKDRKIRLKIAQETSRVLGDGASLSPSTLKRTIDTTVLIEDGNTIVIGGLIDESISDTRYKVPCLGDIPILRLLFSSMGKGDTKTNLFIFLTPHVVGNESEAKELYEVKRKELEAVKTSRIKLYPGEKNNKGTTIDVSSDEPVVEKLDVNTTKED